MNMMWKALQWVYDNGKIPESCKASWKHMLDEKTVEAAEKAAYSAGAVGYTAAYHAAFYAADAIYDVDAVDAVVDAINVCKKLGYTNV